MLRVFNCAPRLKLSYWFERLIFSKSYLQAKYCKQGHGLAYSHGYNPENGHYECPDCGATDLDDLIVNYKTYPWYNFR